MLTFAGDVRTDHQPSLQPQALVQAPHKHCAYLQGGRVLKHWQSSGSNIAGLGEGEVEVMRLREENEALMESLVRTKVDLAETEGALS